MIAAIYARKSPVQNGVTEMTTSVTRQVDHARAYAGRKGWTSPTTRSTSATGSPAPSSRTGRGICAS